MAAPYDLPPWLTGEQDKGFLQGAQLGITAARTGTEIAQTRQQMRESGELQPFRVAAAEIGNRMSRQTMDMKAALFPLEMGANQLRLDEGKLKLVEAGLGLQIKQAEVGDLAVFREAQAKRIAGDTSFKPSFMLPETQSKWMLWDADSEWGRAKANDAAANKLYEAKLIDAAAEQLKNGINPYKTDANGKRSALPDVGLLQMGAKVMAHTRHEEALRTAQGVSDISQGRQIAVQENRLEGRLEEIDARAEAIATSKIDVGMSSLNLAQWKEKARMLREEGKLNGDFTKYRNFVNSAGSNSAAITEPSQVSKLVADATEAYNQAYVEGDAKKLPELEAKAMRAKVLELKASGKVLNRDRPDLWKFEEGEMVVFPGNKTAKRMIEREEHVRAFTKAEAEKMLRQRQIEADKAVEDDKKRRSDKAESERVTSQVGAMWMRSGKTGAF